MPYVKLSYKPSGKANAAGKLFYDIVCGRTSCPFATDYEIYDAEWDELSGIISPRDVAQSRVAQLTDIRKHIFWDLERFNHIIRQHEETGLPVCASQIAETYQYALSEHTFFRYMEHTIGLLEQQGRLRTSETYRTTLRSFRDFRQEADIMIDELTAEDIKAYELSLQRRGVSPNSSSFYMRILRAVYNRAVEAGITRQRHPFKHVYTGVGKTIKRAIPIEAIQRIRECDLSGQHALAFTRDIFLFSFYARGMSFVDLAFLKPSDVQSGFITYRRHKTGTLLHIKIERCMQEIIDRHACPGCKYLFPIIKKEGNEYRQYRSALRMTNARLKKIGNLTGTALRLTTYVSRHSWGSAAKFSNIPLSIISESLGHADEHTTQIYLASLDSSIIDDANSHILRNFNHA